MLLPVIENFFKHAIVIEPSPVRPSRLNDSLISYGKTALQKSDLKKNKTVNVYNFTQIKPNDSPSKPNLHDYNKQNEESQAMQE